MEENQVVNCPSCGKPQPLGGRFCRFCGTNLEELALAAAAAVTPEVKTEQNAQNPSEPIKDETPAQIQPQEVNEENPQKEEAPREDKEEDIIDLKEKDDSIKIKPVGDKYIFGHEIDNDEIKGNPDDLLNPLQKYNDVLKQKFAQETETYFDELVKESGIDVAKATEIGKKAYNAEREWNRYTRLYTKARKNWMIGLGSVLLGIALAVALIFGIFQFTGLLDENGDFGFFHPYIMYIYIGAGALVVIAIALFIARSVIAKNAKKRYQPLIDKYGKEFKDYKEQGYTIMNPLNDLYDYDIQTTLLNRVTPLIDVDYHVDMARIEALGQKFKMGFSLGAANSIVHTRTGAILNNPFVQYSVKSCHMINETYTGSLTIVYQKKYTSNGKTYYMPVTQVLRASCTAPKATYRTSTVFAYGNEAAANLSFSRNKVLLDHYNKIKNDERALNKEIDQEYNKLSKQVEKGKLGITLMANREFEMTFGAINRNNDVEFRLLFTPIAQRSIVDLIKHGHDFSFTKRGMMNYMYAYGYSNEIPPYHFYHYDFNQAKRRFLDSNNNFFSAFYFQFAPVLAIPMYQQYPSHKYEYKGILTNHYLELIIEMIANTYPAATFLPNSQTEILVQCENIEVDYNVIRCQIHAYGHLIVPHVSYFPRKGGDGKIYQVPVHWKEYVPIEDVKPLTIIETFLTKRECKQMMQDDSEEGRKVREIVKHFSFNKGYFSLPGSYKVNGKEVVEYIRKKFNK